VHGRGRLLLCNSGGRKMSHSDGQQDPGGAGAAASALLVMLEGKMDARRLVAAKGNS
jgi:hypothetical protein